MDCNPISSLQAAGINPYKIEMHLVVDSNSVEVAHEITEEVESILDQKYAPVRATIHIEPRSYSSEQISFGEVPATEQSV